MTKRYKSNSRPLPKSQKPSKTSNPSSHKSKLKFHERDSLKSDHKSSTNKIYNHSHNNQEKSQSNFQNSDSSNTSQQHGEVFKY